MLKQSCVRIKNVISTAGSLCKLDRAESALGILAEGLVDSRGWVALAVAREIQLAGKKVRQLAKMLMANTVVLFNDGYVEKHTF